jgi:hypothetical protein
MHNGGAFPAERRMTRPTNIARATTKIADVIRWAERQGFHNVAAELQAALALLPAEAQPKPDKRHHS